MFPPGSECPLLKQAEPNRPPARRALLEAARVAAAAAHERNAAHTLGLDRVAEAAARAAAAPVAAVTLVGADSLHLVGRWGTDVAVLPRAGSFCSAVVDGEAALLVTDAAGAAAHAAHKLVTEAGIRSYAGAPITDADGYAVGAVGVFAPAAHAFGAPVLDDLAALAALVERMLEQQRNRPIAPPRRIQGWLGVKTAPADRGKGGRPGLIVIRVARDSPARRAGLLPADILHSIDGRVLRQPADIIIALADRSAGRPASVALQRRGAWLTLQVEVVPRPA